MSHWHCSACGGGYYHSIHTVCHCLDTRLHVKAQCSQAHLVLLNHVSARFRVGVHHLVQVTAEAPSAERCPPNKIDGTACTLTKHRSRSIRVSLHTQHIFLPVLSASGPAAAGAGAGAAAAAAAEKANVNGELDLARNPEGTRNRTSCRCPLLPWPQFHISTTPVALLQPSIRTTTRPLPAKQAKRRRFVNEHW